MLPYRCARSETRLPQLSKPPHLTHPALPSQVAVILLRPASHAALRLVPGGGVEPLRPEGRRILRERKQFPSNTINCLLLSASDAGLNKIRLRLNTLEYYSVRPLPVTVASLDVSFADERLIIIGQHIRACRDLPDLPALPSR